MKTTFSGPALLLMWPACLSAASGLDELATITDATTHRASSYDRTGGNIDNVESLPPGATHVLMDVKGAGRINHIWFTVSRFINNQTFLRDLVLRMYWEDSPVPSVEVPLGDFFALGHARTYTVQSLPVAVGANTKALNCYWPMPFYKSARIEIHNNGRRSARRLYYHIDYEIGPQPPHQGLFHALYRRERELRTQSHTGNLAGKDNYVILETEGRGQYVGCVLQIDAQPGGWWGEGDDMIFIDHAETPALIGTGSEDYFCNAWGYEEPFSYPFYGAPLLEKRPDGGSFTTVYRWHVQDPIRFRTHIRVTIERLFKDGVVNDFTSIAYWYQAAPITKRPSIPRAEDNHPRMYASPPPTTQATVVEIDGTELEALLNAKGIKACSLASGPHDGYQNGGWLRIDDLNGHELEVVLPVPEDDTYQVQVKVANHLIEPSLRIGLSGGELKAFEKHNRHERTTPYVELGTVLTSNQQVRVVIKGANSVGLDHFRLRRVER